MEKIIIIKAEINEMENRKTYTDKEKYKTDKEKSMKQCGPLKINKIDKSLSKLTREETQFTNIKNEARGITRDNADIKRTKINIMSNSPQIGRTT